MPVLPLTDGDGVLQDDAPLWLLAIMHFPSSLERQQEFYAASWARMILSREARPESMTLGSEAVELLADAKTFDQQQKDIQALFVRGYLVGEVLALICFKSQYDPASASRNKAQYLQRLCLEDAARANPRMSWPKSERSQHQSWREFSPVAHLWAGLILFSQWESGSSEDASFRVLGFRHDEIPQLLGFAEYFRKIGEKFEPTGQRPTAESPSKTVLDPEETWKCPEDLEIPEVDLEFTPSEETVSLLDQYNYVKIYGVK